LFESSTRFDIAICAGCSQDPSPKAAAGLSSSDEEALRQKVVLPEIQRLLQAEREANEEVRWPIHHQKRGLRIHHPERGADARHSLSGRERLSRREGTQQELCCSASLSQWFE
jgi:hypothetical protein